MSPPDIRLSKLDRRAARTDSEGTTLASFLSKNHRLVFWDFFNSIGQNLRLPQRNIGIRFNPISRHYAHKMAVPLP